jgi:hypothetical protein
MGEAAICPRITRLAGWLLAVSAKLIRALRQRWLLKYRDYTNNRYCWVKGCSRWLDKEGGAAAALSMPPETLD